jgi:hypothetical protein
MFGATRVTQTSSARNSGNGLAFGRIAAASRLFGVASGNTRSEQIWAAEPPEPDSSTGFGLFSLKSPSWPARRSKAAWQARIL